MKYLIILVFLVSCSVQKVLLRPKGAARVGIVQNAYERPDFFVPKLSLPDDFHLKKQSGQIMRAPASFQKQQKKLSNRHLYFLSLYSQYKVMGQVLNVKEQINSCPSFHQVLLENDDKVSSYISESWKITFEQNWTSLKSHENKLGYFPVLAMPYSKSKDLYTVLVENSWENGSKHLKKGLEHYYQSSEKEIKQLCDTGIGPGYYIFENMVTYFQKKNTFSHTNKAIKALVRIPVLANMLILDNILKTKNHTQASLSIFDKRLLERTNAKWFGRFIKQLQEKRNEFATLSKDNSKQTVLSLNR